MLHKMISGWVMKITLQVIHPDKQHVTNACIYSGHAYRRVLDRCFANRRFDDLTRYYSYNKLYNTPYRIGTHILVLLRKQKRCTVINSQDTYVIKYGLSFVPSSFESACITPETDSYGYRKLACMKEGVLP